MLGNCALLENMASEALYEIPGGERRVSQTEKQQVERPKSKERGRESEQREGELEG